MNIKEVRKERKEISAIYRNPLNYCLVFTQHGLSAYKHDHYLRIIVFSSVGLSAYCLQLGQ